MTYKIMCWDSIDPKLNLFNIETYSKAAEIVRMLEDKYPKFTFQIFEECLTEV